MKDCPFISEANRMCNVLVNEVKHASTWKDRIDAIDAIVSVRIEEKSMVEEWKHLNSDDNCNTKKEIN